VGLTNNDTTKYDYLVKWDGYSHGENTTETFENINENARELLEEHYSENANMEKGNRL
jgi:hypothetical protein